MPFVLRFSIAASFVSSISLATDHHSPVPRSTPHAGPAGSGPAQPFPAGYCPTPTDELAKTERGPISTSGPFLLVWHQTGRSLRKNQSVCPRSPPLDRRAFSGGRRRSTPVAPSVPAGWPYGAMPVLCLLSLISRNSPKRLGMVSPEFYLVFSGLATTITFCGNNARSMMKSTKVKFFIQWSKT